MAGINRYTQYAPARYEPRAFEEIMQAPRYMREQHDQAEADYSELGDILKDFSNHDIHDELVGEERKRLLDAINSQVDVLNTQGFNKQTSNNFIKLKQAIGEATGPRGTLHRAQAANEAISKGMEDAYAAHKEAGWSDDIAQQYINRDIEEYTKDFQRHGEIKNIQFGRPPKKQNIEEQITKLKSLLGSTKVKKSHDVILGNGAPLPEGTLQELGFAPVYDSRSDKFVFRNPDGYELRLDNFPQVKALMSYISDDWLRPNGAGFLSDAYEQYPIEQRTRDIENLGQVMQTSEYEDMRSINRSVHSPTTSSNSSRTVPTTSDYMYEDNLGTDSIGSSYKEVSNRIQRSLESTLATPRTIRQALEDQRILDEVDTAWENSELYKEYEQDGLFKLEEGVRAIIPEDVLASKSLNALKNSFSYDEEKGGFILRGDVTVNPRAKTLKWMYYEGEDLMPGRIFTQDEVNLVRDYVEGFKDYEKDREVFRDEELSRRGREMKVYRTGANVREAGAQTELKNLGMTLNPNHMQVMSGKVIDGKTGNVSNLDLDVDADTSNIINLIKGDNLEFQRFDVATQGSDIGFFVEAKIKGNRAIKIGKKKLPYTGDDGNTFQFFVGLKDLNTERGSSIAISEALLDYPPEVRHQMEKILRSHTLNPITVGESYEDTAEAIQTYGVDAASYFPGETFTYGAKLGMVAKTVENSSGTDLKPYKQVYTPTISQGASVESIPWSAFLTGFDKLKGEGYDYVLGNLLESVSTDIGGYIDLAKNFPDKSYYINLRNAAQNVTEYPTESLYQQALIEEVIKFFNAASTSSEVVEIDDLTLMENLQNLKLSLRIVQN